MFDKEKFSSLVQSIKLGKHLPDAIYLHESTFPELPTPLVQLIEAVSSALKIPREEWNLVKLWKKEFRLSLLSYPDFFENAYPELAQSVSIDLTALRHRLNKYDGSDNPPILHRKETMLSTSHPDIEMMKQVTKEAEQAGLYENTRVIGYKQSWLKLIRQKGYELVDGRLFRASSTEQPEVVGIDRHKTAIARYELSAPMKQAAKHGYLDGNYSIFDYGCGRGDDLRELEAHGIDAIGWDPVFRPDADKASSDLVNLGFVVNVIEDPVERMEAVLGAWELTDKLLIVSVMLANEDYISRFRPYKDGVITSRNTFQKYYSQSEFKGYLERVLDEKPIAVAPGIFYVYKDKLEEQAFLAHRQKRHHKWNQLTTRENISEERMKLLFIQHKPLFDALWKRCLELGRLPTKDEFDEYEALQHAIGSINKAYRVLQQVADISEFEEAAKIRKEDRLVYFALSLFSKRKPYKHIAEPLKRDIKAFFGDYSAAQEQAKELLFSVADTELIEQACNAAYKTLAASFLDESHSLTFHESQLENLPMILRVYVGCAVQLHGELDGVDLIKLHITSGKVTFLSFDNFYERSIPLLKERIKVNLRHQDVDYFEYGDRYIPQPLFHKSRYLNRSDEIYKKQTNFEARLIKLGVLGEDEKHGPNLVEFTQRFKDAGKYIKGYRIYNDN